MGVSLNVHELSYLAGFLTPRAEEGDPIARALYIKFKAAAVADGVTWVLPRYEWEP